MSRAITLGNGNLLVGLDERGLVRDLYFPNAGHPNHVSGAGGTHVHRVGVHTDGTLKWLSDPSWSVKARFAPSSGASDIEAKNAALGVALSFTDVVHNERNIFLRKIRVTNEEDRDREIKVFFGQEFCISETRRGDTAFYDPRVRAVVHYKGHITLLAYAQVNGVSFTDYSIGLFGIEGKEGTYADAEDGVLSRNPIEHGSVDSVIGVTLILKAQESADVDYWVIAGQSIKEVHELHAHTLEETPKHVVESTENYWLAWKNKEEWDFSPLPIHLTDFFKHSLVIIRTHTDNRGGIIASSDTDILNQGRDTYSYLWPRDAAIVANALDRVGHTDVAQRFFSLMARCLEPDGYLMHKYRVDGVLGSSWHPWIQDGHFRLPIQEDETATVLFMLAEHYRRAKDIEFIESLYNPFVLPAADFLSQYIEPETGLPRDSYDLWEEKYGSSTYTAASVYGALHAAAELAATLGKRDAAGRYREKAERVKQAIFSYLYDPHSRIFHKLVRHHGKTLEYDRTVDMSSLFGIVKFGVCEASDVRVKRAFDGMVKYLKVPTEFGGYVRYVGDRYYKTSEEAPSNAWCITTLWVARFIIRAAKHREELKPALDILEWVHARASSGGILPEQIHPYTGAPLSAAPLIWSHAEYVITVDEYLKKYASIR